MVRGRNLRKGIAMAIRLLTPDQAVAQVVLTCAIRVALDSGRRVPCQQEPATWWDDPYGLPSLCDGCPVLRQCEAYADTGAVEHGVIAGRRLADRRQQPQAFSSEAAA